MSAERDGGAKEVLRKMRKNFTQYTLQTTNTWIQTILRDPPPTNESSCTSRHVEPSIADLTTTIEIQRDKQKTFIGII